MATYSGPDDLSGTEFIETNFAGSVFREVDLSGVRIRGALLNGADLDGVIDGLRVNGVEVAPLVEAELDRLHPERTRLRPSTPDGMRIAWETVEAFWAPTMARAGSMPEQDVHRSVDGEWSFVQTLRHLLFVTDSWVRRGVLGERAPWHHLDLPPTGMTRVGGLDDADVRASFDEVLALRAERTAVVDAVMVELTDARLDEEVRAVGAGHPKAGLWPVRRCLEAQVNEEWRHRDYAERDLTKLTDRGS